ncbi:PIN domain-containing protein [Tolypothrix sp. FACHB-123]|uniref:type II toxin-antitoxin system VapC family toxin n=1 Tax=Tolypothrix sp. FACHB-123 TaxID=2692868 RepID=UPI001F552375|nr:PIN domain-containing protein [Tolypothrix sp. FACHB-123]
MFNSQGLTTIEVSPDIAETAAQLRADYNLRTPDAIQIATAIRGGASFFLTRIPHFIMKHKELHSCTEAKGK